MRILLILIVLCLTERFFCQEKMGINTNNPTAVLHVVHKDSTNNEVAIMRITPFVNTKDQNNKYRNKNNKIRRQALAHLFVDNNGYVIPSHIPVLYGDRRDNFDSRINIPKNKSESEKDLSVIAELQEREIVGFTLRTNFSYDKHNTSLIFAKVLVARNGGGISLYQKATTKNKAKIEGEGTDQVTFNFDNPSAALRIELHKDGKLTITNSTPGQKHESSIAIYDTFRYN